MQSYIEKLLAVIELIVQSPDGNWREKRQRIIDIADNNASFEEFISWFEGDQS